jgi:hypothetical protein
MKKLLPIVGLVILLTLFVAPAASAAPPASGGDDCGGQHHCVRWGETLHSIGRMYDKHPQFLAQVNGLYNPHRLFAGQILYIPADGPPYPWHAGGCWGHDCGRGHQKPTPYYSHGHDYNHHDYYYKGYYPHYKRYGYTCGYYGNCY